MTPFDRTPLPVNPPSLTQLVEVRSLGGFCVAGQLVPAGATVRLPKYVALSLVAQGKAELI
jgi:hypothetical protein